MARVLPPPSPIVKAKNLYTRKENDFTLKGLLNHLVYSFFLFILIIIINKLIIIINIFLLVIRETYDRRNLEGWSSNKFLTHAELVSLSALSQFS